MLRRCPRRADLTRRGDGAFGRPAGPAHPHGVRGPPVLRDAALSAQFSVLSAQERSSPRGVPFLRRGGQPQAPVVRVRGERAGPVGPTLRTWASTNRSARSADSLWPRSYGGTRRWARGYPYGLRGRAGITSVRRTSTRTSKTRRPPPRSPGRARRAGPPGCTPRRGPDGSRRHRVPGHRDRGPARCPAPEGLTECPVAGRPSPGTGRSGSTCRPPGRASPSSAGVRPRRWRRASRGGPG